MALILLAAFPVPQAVAQSAYTERLNVYIAGGDALWYMSFTGVNSSSKLSGLESTPGLSWYNITAVKTTGWQSDYLVFGSSGYNLLPMPSLPPQGLFLKVGSDTFADALAAANSLDPYLLTNFVSSSNGTGVYSFYSPVSFDSLMPTTLMTLVPTTEGGFTKAITTTSFAATDSPMVILQGQKSSAGFNRTLELGSITRAALDSVNRPNILAYFGSTLSSLKASSQSSSSVLNIRFLDGLINASAKDKAVVTTSTSSFSASYSLTIAPGKAITKVNATVVERPVTLLATRTVDTGVLHTGDNLSVTITLTNLSPSTAITSVKFNDTWWKSLPEFKYLSGNFTAPSGGIQAGLSVTPVYRLQYVGTTAGQVIIPTSVARFTYKAGGSEFDGMASLNPIRLSLGTDDAVVYATLAPVGGLGKSVGASQNMSVTLVNVGTRAASSVSVDGRSVSGLAAGGGTAKVVFTQSAPSLTDVNVTTAYQVSYQNPSGTQLNATSNVIADVFGHQGMKVAYVSLAITSSFSYGTGGVGNLTLTFTTSNTGPARAFHYTAQAQLPPGFGCGKAYGDGISCSSGEVMFAYSNLSSSKTAHLQYNVTSPANFLLGPISFGYNTSGYSFSGTSNPVDAPSGLRVAKGFTPSQLFGGMTSEVSVSASNAGPFTYYNATVRTTSDAFDTLTGSGSSSKTTAALAPSGNVSTSFGVTVAQTSGNLSSTPVTAAFFFGGVPYTIDAPGPRVLVYQPLTASITTSPSSPIEGKSFTLRVVINNPSGVPVSNVLFKLPIPSGLSLTNVQNAQVASGVLTVSVSTLAAHQSVNATGSAVASSGITVPFDKGTLSFNYNGVTVAGRLPAKGIAVGEDVTTRYIIPTGIVLLVLIAAAFYLRRLAAPSAPASPR